MGNRPPRFETHIRPMFRAIDRQRMLSRFDLWDYSDVTQPDTLAKICDRVARAMTSPIHGEMPPFDFGGPWPFEWIELFLRWANSGCLRLESVTSDVLFQVVPLGPSAVSLVAKGTNPDFGYAVWFEPEFGATAPLRFSLYREPPEVIPPFGTKQFQVSIDFQPGSATEAFVNGVSVPLVNPTA